MKLCVFQGTFNPIHNAHLKMAEFVLKNKNFDKIIFIPAYKPPHKDYLPQLSKHRFNLVKLAIDNNSQFEISDVEYQSEQKSYTFLTIQKLYQLYNIDDKINFIVGTDAFEKIETWYEADKLKKLIKFLIFSRENESNNKILSELRTKGYDFELMPMDFTDISSTQIRENIKVGKPITDLVPQKVEEYIKQHELYK